jgi:hypothetical protein
MTYSIASGGPTADSQTDELFIVLQVGSGEKITKYLNLDFPYLGGRTIYVAFDTLASGFVQLIYQLTPS